MKVFISSTNISAVGIYNVEENNVEVLKDSHYRVDPALSQREGSIRLLEELTEKRILKEGFFLENHKFDSPSAAASVILGRPSNGKYEWKDEEGITIGEHLSRQKFINFIKENYNSSTVKEYIKACDDTIQRVQDIYPLETLETLPLENWDKRGSRESVTYLIEHGTSEMLSGFLGSNQNKLIYQLEDLTYEATNATMNKYEGDTVEEKYTHFIKNIYYSIVRYNDSDYLENKDEYALVGANVLFTKLLSFYKPESILLMASSTYFKRILDYLGLGNFDNDSIVANIILKSFIYNHIDESTNIYAVSHLVYNFYRKEIEPLFDTKEVLVLEETMDIESVDLDHIFIEDDKINEILNILERKQNIILQGVPGVGKTFIIQNILESRYNITKDNYQTVQFHQSYSYEEFVEGLRPVNGVFEVKEGLFKEFSNKAANDPENNYFFIIDEINRGNLSKIFGELLMLIESDKREDYNVKLPYSGDEFTIPKNLYIIGTMNTADRSLSLVDYALRRRFSFITLNPAFDTDKFNKYMIDKLKYTKDQLEEINTTMLSLNKTITNNLSKNFEIGHSYFVTKDRSSSFDEFLDEVYKYEILPLLEEYFFDDETLVKRMKNEMGIHE